MSDLNYRLSLDNAQYLRSMRDAQGEVRQLGASSRSANLGELSGELQMAAGSTSTFTGQMREANGGLADLINSSPRAAAAIKGVGMGFAGAGAVLAGGMAVFAGARAALSAMASEDGLTRGLMALEGTAERTTARLNELRGVARMPGLGFEEAVQGDIRLRSAGLSAEMSTRSMKAFGNALATVGGGKQELDGVMLAMMQMQSVGKILSQDIMQISQRVPQMRAAMKEAFGTASVEDIQATGMSVETFLSGVIEQLEKLPKASGGAQNALDNFDDSFKSMKTSMAGLVEGPAVGLMGMFEGISTGARYAIRDMKELFGMRPAALSGGSGIDPEATRAAAAAEEAAAKEEAAATDLANQQARIHNSRIAREEATNEDARQRKVAAERAALLQIAAAAERAAAARLTAEQNLQRQIDAVKASGAVGQKAFDAAPDAQAKARIADRTARLIELEAQLGQIREANIEKGLREADVADKRSQAAFEKAQAETSARQGAQREFATELAILEARGKGHEKAAQALERQARLESLKLQLIKEQGFSEAKAAELAERRIRAEEAAAGRDGGRRPRRGLLNAEESAMARYQRQSKRDKEKTGGSMEGFLDRDNTTRLSLQARQRVREATAGAATAADLRPDRKDGGSAEIVKKLSKLDSIDARLADLGLAPV